MRTFLNQLNKHTMMDFLIAMVEEHFQDFPGIQQGYIQAMETLQNSIGESAVHKEKEAICQQIASIVLFSGVLGLQANYHYFSDPVGGNFLNTDPEVYLRENIAKHLPEYAAAQQSRSEFYSRLDAAQKELYQPVTEYTSYLETVGPKLAHYFGYLSGNELLQRVVPGYHPDMAFTLQYCIKLEGYFGKRLDLNNILKESFSFC